jgi:hypothetical protein
MNKKKAIHIRQILSSTCVIGKCKKKCRQDFIAISMTLFATYQKMTDPD